MKNFKYILFSLMLIISCLDENYSSILDSDDYQTSDERVEILKTEIRSSSIFEDAEFELFNVNGFLNNRTSVPGASSCDYKFAIKVDNSDIEEWCSGMITIYQPEYDDKWAKEIVEKRNKNWSTLSAPILYTRNGDNVIMLVYADEGIIFKRVIIN